MKIKKEVNKYTYENIPTCRESIDLSRSQSVLGSGSATETLFYYFN